MKRFAIVCMVLMIIGIVVGLSRTALDPEDFSGLWYSSDDPSAYLFQEGLIYRSHKDPKVSGLDSFCGAYWFCRDSVFLFVQGMDGLETEKELYLVYGDDVSFLCEHADGSGKNYFIRYKE